MLCDDTIECSCNVFRNQENDTEAQNNQSAYACKNRSTLLSIFTVSSYNSSLHSFANFSIHLQLICSLINVISGNE